MISALKNNFCKDELRGIDSESELNLIFGKTADFNDKIVTDIKSPSEIFIFDNLKDIKPLADKITVD